MGKRILTLVLIVGAIGTAGGCRRDRHEPGNAVGRIVPNPNATVAAIAIPTAKCENCEKTIRNAVAKVGGVTGVEVDAKRHVAEVQYIAAKTNVGALEQAIAGSGYTANQTTRDSAAYDKLDACCK